MPEIPPRDDTVMLAEVVEEDVCHLRIVVDTTVIDVTMMILILEAVSDNMAAGLIVWTEIPKRLGAISTVIDVHVHHRKLRRSKRLLRRDVLKDTSIL